MRLCPDNSALTILNRLDYVPFDDYMFVKCSCSLRWLSLGIPEQVSRQVCESCKPETREVCESVPSHNCTVSPRQSCQTQEKTQPREICENVPEEHCGPVTACQPSSQQVCQQVTHQGGQRRYERSFQVPRRVPQEVCRTIEREICEQTPSKGKISK